MTIEYLLLDGTITEKIISEYLTELAYCCAVTNANNEHVIIDRSKQPLMEFRLVNRIKTTSKNHHAGQMCVVFSEITDLLEELGYLPRTHQ